MGSKEYTYSRGRDHGEGSPSQIVRPNYQYMALCGVCQVMKTGGGGVSGWESNCVQESVQLCTLKQTISIHKSTIPVQVQQRPILLALRFSVFRIRVSSYILICFPLFITYLHPRTLETEKSPTKVKLKVCVLLHITDLSGTCTESLKNKELHQKFQMVFFCFPNQTTPLLAEAKFLVHDWGILAGLYDNPLPDSTISPPSGTKNLTTGPSQPIIC